MHIHKIDSTTSFNGLWEPVKVLKKETGVYNRNKVLYTLKDFVYHPFINETEAEIKAATEKYFFGRNFSLWDRFDNHHKCDIIQMNRIKIGEKVLKEKENEYIADGWTTEPIAGIPNDEAFKQSYYNDTYAAFDVSMMDAERVKDVASRHFDTKA